MTVRRTWIWGGLFCAGLAWAAEGKGPESVKLVFAPQAGTACTIRQTDERMSYVGGNEAPVSSERMERDLTCHLDQDGDGWRMQLKAGEYSLIRNGEEDDNPLMEAMKAAPLVFRIDAAGHVRAVEGYEVIADQLVRSGVSLEGIFSREAFPRRLMSEWETRLGQFMGQTLPMGATAVQNVPGTTGYSTRVAYEWVSECGRAGCVRVTQTFSADLGSVVDAMKPALQALVQDASRGQIDSMSGRDAVMQGTAERLIDARTGLLMEEHIERETRLVVEAEGKAPTPVRMVEIQSRDYDYTYPPVMPGATAGHGASTAPADSAMAE